jgi:hypothetical protein
MFSLRLNLFPQGWREGLPDEDEGAGEVVGAVGDPAGDFGRGEPVARFDFFGVQDKWAFGGVTVNPTEFPAGLAAGVDFEKALRGLAHDETDFLAEFAHGAGVIILTGVHMAGGGGIPFPGGGVLFQGTFLQEDLAGGVENEDMNGPVPKTARVDFAARGLTGHFVTFVDEVENFFAHFEDKAKG